MEFHFPSVALEFLRWDGGEIGKNPLDRIGRKRANSSPHFVSHDGPCRLGSFSAFLKMTKSVQFIFLESVSFENTLDLTQAGQHMSKSIGTN